MQTPSMESRALTLQRAERRGAARATGFHRWLQQLDVELLESLVQVRAWVGVGAIGLLVIWIGGVIPWTSQYFEIRPLPALLLFFPVVALGVALAVWRGRKRLSLASFAVGLLICSALFQVFLWGLVALSRWPGAAALASFPVFLAAYHGHSFQSAPQTPYVATGVLVGLMVAYAINHTGPHVSLYLLVGPMAFGTALVLGLNSARAQRARGEAVATRAAFDAQLLSERALRVTRLDELLKSVESTNHDARSALSGALFSLDRLLREGTKPGGNAKSATSLTLDALREVGQLRAILESGRDSYRDRPQDEVCDLAKVLHEVVASASERFPGCHVRVSSDAVCTACLVGGATSAHRIITNLLVNAYEGDGATGARQITVRLSSHPEPTLTVADDGPGLPGGMLQSSVNAFTTTKPQGTGLGLYTVDRLVRASGGSLSFSSADRLERGCQVSVRLRPGV